MKKIIIIVLFCFFSSCKVTLISDYDKGNVDSILAINKEIDVFYDLIIYKEKSSKFKDNVSDYIKINSEIKTLYRRNEVKRKNSEMVRNIFLVDSVWNVYQKQHQKYDSLSVETFILFKTKIDHHFEDLLHSEEVKNIIDNNKN